METPLGALEYESRSDSSLDFGTHSALSGWGLTFQIRVRIEFGGRGRMQIERVALLLIALGAVAGYLPAQTGGEASATMSNAGVAAQVIRSPSFTFSSSGSPKRHSSGSSFAASRKGAPVLLVAPSGPPPDEANRKIFEENAGKDAGKVLFRSVPSGASVFLNHRLVGNTPLLLFLAPAKYDVEMRGARQASGHGVLAVTPKRSQTVVIDMSQRYPSSVSLRW